MGDLTHLFSQYAKRLISQELKYIISQNIRPSLKVVALMILLTGIAYPLVLIMIGEVTLPFQSNGSLFKLDDKVIGSKLIAQEFASDKLFHSRPTANSTSGVDPHITPEEAFSQVPRISRATGLEVNTLKTIIQLDLERNKVSNMLVFAPLYVNVLQVNLDLISGYPKTYQEFTTNTSWVR
ncbi:MAG: potassium-transporting ATPase subunit C [Nitrososphaeraceae archaeon]